MAKKFATAEYKRKSTYIFKLARKKLQKSKIQFLFHYLIKIILKINILKHLFAQNALKF